MYESGGVQAQQLAETLHKNDLEHQQVLIANARRLQLEAQTVRMSQDMEQQTLSVAHQREVKLRRLQDKSTPQPEQLKENRKQQLSQTATSKAEIHALHTEFASMEKKFEFKTTLSAKMINKEGPRPTVEIQTESLLNTRSMWFTSPSMRT